MKKVFLIGAAFFLAWSIFGAASSGMGAERAAKQAPMMPAAPALSGQAPVNGAGGLLERTAGSHVIGFGAREVVFGNGSHAFRLEFVGARGVTPESTESIASSGAAIPESPEGQGPAGQKAAALGTVTYRGLWPGITLSYGAEKAGVAKSVWTVAPRAPVHSIRLRSNAPVRVDEGGKLVYSFAQGMMTESKPVAWQEIGGKRVPVDVTYRLEGKSEFGFAAAAYDFRYPLTIDPILSWNTFLGGYAYDLGNSIVLDSSGNVYVVGSSGASWGMPIRAFTGSPNIYDVFIAKLSSNGTLLWNTFLGGQRLDYGYAIGLDAWGNIYVSGESYDTWGSPIRAFSSAPDEFVAKLSPNGELLWNTFLGGAGEDTNASMAVFPNGDCYVAGSSKASWGSPVRPFYAEAFGYMDMSIAKVGYDGALQWNTFLGGTHDDKAYGIALDNDGGVYVAGTSDSSWGNPIIPFPSSSSLDEKVAVAKLNSGGSLIWNTFFRQFYGQHECSGISVSPQNLLVVVGKSSYTWGTPINPFAGGSFDGFAAALELNGHLVWNTFLGGAGQDACTSVAVSEAGYIYICGYSGAAWGSPDGPFGGSTEGFVVRLNAGGQIQALTFLGGASNALALDDNRNIYVTGVTSASFGLPIRPYSQGPDAFVSKVTFIPDVLNRVAVGRFDSVGIDGAVMSFPGMGVWKYSAGTWSQLSPDYAEELVAADVDEELRLGMHHDIVGDFGDKGLWLWQAGSWTQLTPVDVEYVTAFNFDFDWRDELFCDFGALGLWYWDDGAWTQLSASNPDYFACYSHTFNTETSNVLIADFGAEGLWTLASVYHAEPHFSIRWNQFSDRNPDFFLTVESAPYHFVGDFGAQGLWISEYTYAYFGWTQLSGLDPEYMITGSFDASGAEEIIADFGPVGLWLWNGSAWTQISGEREEYMIAAGTGPGYPKAFVDFGPLGLWEYDGGVWTQLTGVSPEYMTKGDFDGDRHDELMVDFGRLGLWMWDSGTWTLLLGYNPS